MSVFFIWVSQIVLTFNFNHIPWYCIFCHIRLRFFLAIIVALSGHNPVYWCRFIFFLCLCCVLSKLESITTPGRAALIAESYPTSVTQKQPRSQTVFRNKTPRCDVFMQNSRQRDFTFFAPSTCYAKSRHLLSHTHAREELSWIIPFASGLRRWIKMLFSFYSGGLGGVESRLCHQNTTLD